MAASIEFMSSIIKVVLTVLSIRQQAVGGRLGPKLAGRVSAKIQEGDIRGSQ